MKIEKLRDVRQRALPPFHYIFLPLDAHWDEAHEERIYKHTTILSTRHDVIDDTV